MPGRKPFSKSLHMYSTMINGYTRINITKLDVLTGIPEIKVAVAYATPCLLGNYYSTTSPFP